MDVTSGLHLRSRMERRHLLLHWRLDEYAGNTLVSQVASGVTFTRASARTAIQSWHRIWLKRRGEL